MDLNLYGDADFAGDRPSYKSTSGMVMYALGPRTSFPIAAKSVKQSCRSHSTPEAEIVAMNAALRTIGLPALDLWDTILAKKAKVHFQEDNETAIIVAETGRNPTMRHIGRTHGVQIGWIHETFKRGTAVLHYVPTDKQRADIFTKMFRDVAKWDHAVKLIGMFRQPVSDGGDPTLLGHSKNDSKNTAACALLKRRLLK